MLKNDQPEVSAINTISRNTKVKGDIDAAGDLRIDGDLEGNLNCKGRVVVGADASIKGIVKCKTGDILGTVEGELIVDDLLSLKSTAFVNGNITMGKLSVEPGANFTGKCSMNGEPSRAVKKKPPEIT